MKKICIAILSLILVYSFFREFTLVRVLIILAGAAAGFGVFRLPQRAIEAMKYPLIIISFVITVLLFFYPKVAIPEIARMAVVFVSFYGLAFYLIGIENKDQDFFKEVTALSILFLSSGFNLYVSGSLIYLISFALALIFFLFILGRYRIIAFIAAYTLIACFMIYRQKTGILGSGLTGLSDINKYMLLGTSFALLVISFAADREEKQLFQHAAIFRFSLRRNGYSPRCRDEIVRRAPVSAGPFPRHHRPACGNDDENGRRAVMKLVISAGGTGGHIFPGIAVAESLMAQNTRQ